MNTKNPPKKWQGLSNRQQKIAAALAKGKLSRPDLAERFGISVKTVDAHRRNILIALHNPLIELGGFTHGACLHE